MFAKDRRSALLPLTALLLLLASACASPYRRVALGSTAAAVGTDGSAQGIPVAASADRFQIDFHITTAEATQLRVVVRCPGATHEDIVGESMASYRERRLQELQSQQARQEQDRARALGTANAALAGVAQVNTPVVQATAELEVEAEIEKAPAPVVELGPYDRGAQSIHQSVILPGGDKGACTMSLLSLEKGSALVGVSGYMEVTHLIDRAQARARKAKQETELGLRFRTTMQAELVARGADPELRSRQRAAEMEKQRLALEAKKAKAREDARVARVALEARLELERAEREKRRRASVTSGAGDRDRQVVTTQVDVQVKVQADAEIEQRPRVAVVVEPPAVDTAYLHEQERLRVDLLLRSRIAKLCVASGADVYYRARLRQAAFDREQRKQRESEQRAQAALQLEIDLQTQRQEQLVVDLGTRETVVAWLLASGADPEYRRKQNEADLRSFEERNREAYYAAQRDASAELAMESDGEFGQTVAVNYDPATSHPQTSVAAVAKPAPPAEVQPPRPDSQSSWIAGFYQWQAGAWIWVPGTWTTPPVQDAVWVPTVEINLGGQLIRRPGAWRTQAGKRVHSPRPKATVRDHRN